MHKRFKSLIIFTGLVLLLTGCNEQSSSSSTDTSSDTSVTDSSDSSSSEYSGEYYSTISASATGTILRDELNALNNTKRKRTVGYAGFKTTFTLTERIPGVTPANKMVGFYDNVLVNAEWDNQKTWNREHVWPKSHGGGTVDNDIHMVRPASVSANSGRGNDFYAASGAYDPGAHGDAYYRGVSSRIIFYCCIANKNLSLIDQTSHSTSNANPDYMMGKLSDLLKWNLQYLPSTSETADTALRVEQNRNNVIESNAALQGNRNPFIDHPEYACKIWGNTNSATKSICGM